MSFTENDRNFRSYSGKTFPVVGSAAFDSMTFQAAIASGLRRDFGGTTAAVKRVAKLVKANERGVRNWFDAKNGPSGEHLVMLMHHSPTVMETVLAMSGHSDLVRLSLVADAKDRLHRILAMVDGLTQA